MTEKKLIISRGKMPYLSFGSGPAILFLHGGVATPYAYTKLLELLAGKYTLIAPTHPGHGNAFSITEDWNLDDFVSSYMEFIREINLDFKVIIGHSFGGTLALLLTIKNSLPVIAMDPACLPLPVTIREYLDAVTLEMEEMYRERPDLASLNDTIPAAGTLIHTAIKHPESVTWFYKNGSSIDIRTDLPNINAPVELFWGEADAIVPVSQAETVKNLIQGSGLKIFEHLGHTYPVTKTEFTYSEIKIILKKYGL